MTDIGERTEPGAFWLLSLILFVSFALAFIGATVGLVLGHLRLPLLIAYLGSPHQGAMMNLVVSGGGALGGVIRHVRDGRVNWTAFALMGIPSAVGAIIAVFIFIHINPMWSYLVIGCVLVISGMKLIRHAEPDPPPTPISRFRLITLEIIIGLALGGLGAITGLMLGTLRLPMMIRYLRMDPKQAVGVNMAVGCLTAVIGVIAGLLAGTGGINRAILWAVVPATFLGGWLGGQWTGRLTKNTVRKLSGWIITVSGLIMLGQAMALTLRKPLAKPQPLLVDDRSKEFDGFFDFEDWDENETLPPPREVEDPDEDDHPDRDLFDRMMNGD